MWAAILAFLQSIPILGKIVDKLIPSREERQIDAIRKEKQRERQWIDDWVDRGDHPPPV